TNKIRRMVARWPRTGGQRPQRRPRRPAPLLAVLLSGIAYYLGVCTQGTRFALDGLDTNLTRMTRPVVHGFGGRPPVVPRLAIRLLLPAGPSGRVSHRAIRCSQCSRSTWYRWMGSPRHIPG